MKKKTIGIIGLIVLFEIFCLAMAYAISTDLDYIFKDTYFRTFLIIHGVLGFVGGLFIFIRMIINDK